MLHDDLFGASRRRIRRTGLCLFGGLTLSVAAAAGLIMAANTAEHDGAHESADQPA